MAAANTETMGASATAASNATPACQKNNSGDWMERFQGFFQTPMEEHKACLKVTYEKMVGGLKEKTGELKDKTVELKEKTAASWRSKNEGKPAPAPVETSPKK